MCFFPHQMHTGITTYGFVKKSVMPLLIFWISFLYDLRLNFIGKLLIFRWKQIVLLLLQMCFFIYFFFLAVSHEIRDGIIKSFNSTLRHLEDLLNITIT